MTTYTVIPSKQKETRVVPEETSASSSTSTSAFDGSAASSAEPSASLQPTTDIIKYHNPDFIFQSPCTKYSFLLFKLFGMLFYALDALIDLCVGVRYLYIGELDKAFPTLLLVYYSSVITTMICRQWYLNFWKLDSQNKDDKRFFHIDWLTHPNKYIAYMYTLFIFVLQTGPLMSYIFAFEMALTIIQLKETMQQQTRTQKTVALLTKRIEIYSATNYHAVQGKLFETMFEVLPQIVLQIFLLLLDYKQAIDDHSALDSWFWIRFFTTIFSMGGVFFAVFSYFDSIYTKTFIRNDALDLETLDDQSGLQFYLKCTWTYFFILSRVILLSVLVFVLYIELQGNMLIFNTLMLSFCGYIFQKIIPCIMDSNDDAQLLENHINSLYFIWIPRFTHKPATVNKYISYYCSQFFMHLGVYWFINKGTMTSPVSDTLANLSLVLFIVACIVKIIFYFKMPQISEPKFDPQDLKWLDNPTYSQPQPRWQSTSVI